MSHGVAHEMKHLIVKAAYELPPADFDEWRAWLKYQNEVEAYHRLEEWVKRERNRLIPLSSIEKLSKIRRVSPRFLFERDPLCVRCSKETHARRLIPVLKVIFPHYNLKYHQYWGYYFYGISFSRKVPRMISRLQ